MEKNKAKTVICPNCGASIYENDASCPFCGYINIPGAEEKFMRDIRKTEQDMGEIPKLQKEEYKKSLSKSSKIIFTTIAITAVLFIACALFLFGFEKITYYDSGKNAKAQMIWNSENFPILDAMYAEEDYDGILEYEYRLFEQNAENDTNYQMYDWEHYNFLSGYRNYKKVEEFVAKMDNRQLSKYEVKELVYNCLWFYDRQYNKNREFMIYTDEEIALLDSYREITNGYMFGKLGFTQEEADKVMETMLTDYGILDVRKSYKYAEKIADRFQ